MSEIQFKYSGNACSPCFLAHRGCVSRDNTCCLRAKPNQRLIDAAPCIGNNVETSIVADLRQRSVEQQKGLDIPTKSRYIMKFQAISGLHSNCFELRGPIDIGNKDFVAQFDNMIDDKWGPKIQAKDGAVKSILLLWNISVPPFHEHDLSHTFAYFIIMRIKDLVADVMSSVRSLQREHDIEPMCFMVIWCLYSLMMLKQLPRLGRCEILDNPELLNHIRNFLTSSRKEQQMRLATDCKNNNNNVDWAAPVVGSQRGLKRIFEDMEERIMKPWTLYFTVIPYNDGGLGDVAPNMHVISSTLHSSHSSSSPIPRNYSGLFKMPEFALSKPYITAAVPKHVTGATSGAVWKGSNGIDCNNCKIGEAEAFFLRGYMADQIPGCISSSYNSTYGAFAMACSNMGLGGWGNESNNLNTISGEQGFLNHGAFTTELWQMPPPSPILYGQPSICDFVQPSQGPASTGYQVNPHLSASLKVPSQLTTWTDFTVNMRPVAVQGLAYDSPLSVYAGTNEPADLNLSQIINVFADKSGHIPQHLQ